MQFFKTLVFQLLFLSTMPLIHGAARTRTRDFYEVLGVTPRQTCAQIKEKFNTSRSLTEVLEIESLSGKNQERYTEDMQRIAEAHATLIDSAQRFKYDIAQGRETYEHAAAENCTSYFLSALALPENDSVVNKIDKIVACNLLANKYQESGNVLESLKYYVQVKDRYIELTPHIQYGNIIPEKNALYHELYQNMSALYAQADQKIRGIKLLLYERSVHAFNERKYDEVMLFLHEFMKFNTDNEKNMFAYYMLAMMATGSESIIFFNKALTYHALLNDAQQSDKNVKRLFARGGYECIKYLFEQKDLNAALAQTNQFLSQPIFNDDPQCMLYKMYVHTIKAKIHTSENNLEDVLTEYGLARDSYHQLTPELRLEAQLTIHEFNEAIESIKTKIALEAYEAGLQAFNEKKYDVADLYLNKYLESRRCGHQRNMYVYYMRGTIHLSHDEFEHAFTCYESAWASYRECTETQRKESAQAYGFLVERYYDLVAKTYKDDFDVKRDMDRINRVQMYVDRCIALPVSNNWHAMHVWYIQGQIYHQLGRKKEASTAYHTAYRYAKLIDAATRAELPLYTRVMSHLEVEVFFDWTGAVWKRPVVKLLVVLAFVGAGWWYYALRTHNKRIA